MPALVTLIKSRREVFAADIGTPWPNIRAEYKSRISERQARVYISGRWRENSGLLNGLISFIDVRDCLEEGNVG